MQGEQLLMFTLAIFSDTTQFTVHIFRCDTNGAPSLNCATDILNK